ncbi:accA [Symbiodinium necroappetens]|uniref:acetyl-CoA carboxytransferase n=1 Tax=Symbiodinium necroappetens TaxID=1628268 RepID=A0A812MSF1_9DINO|nr:accA [Symbiodinium necroappetens]
MAGGVGHGAERAGLAREGGRQGALAGAGEDGDEEAAREVEVGGLGLGGDLGEHLRLDAEEDAGEGVLIFREFGDGGSRLDAQGLPLVSALLGAGDDDPVGGGDGRFGGVEAAADDGGGHVAAADDGEDDTRESGMAIPYTLAFEKPVVEIEKKLSALGAGVDRAGDDPGETKGEIDELRKQHARALKKAYKALSPWDTVRVARHPERPQFRDYVSLICKDFVELHGDRRFGDDPAIVTGFARIDSIKCLLVGHHKGRDTNEKLASHFGCAHPEGYRKALLKMKLAEKFGLPIVTFVDTPGAYPGLGAEQRGQAEAIAVNLREMARIETPIISLVIGEGGSGGALGIAVADRVAMLEHAWYSVISPEGCAAILWKEANEQTNTEAARALCLTASDNLRLGIIDDVVKEPVGGAHRDPKATAEAVKKWIVETLTPMKRLKRSNLPSRRYKRFRGLGTYTEAPAEAVESGPDGGGLNPRRAGLDAGQRFEEERFGGQEDATTTKKTVRKKAPAKKPTSKKATTKKAPAKKATTKKSAASKKATTKKATTKKTASKKATTKKSSASKKSGSAKSRSSGASKEAKTSRYKKLTKSPFNKKQLDEFREILQAKRALIVGDVSSMEMEALTGGGSGSLSHLPQHMADQGSDTFDQSLNLDLAASQRKLLKEIDDALARIENGTYGVCEMLGKQIKIERLRHTPWARYSIDAARARDVPVHPAWRSGRAWAVLLVVVVAALFADLASKSWAFANLSHAPVVIDRAEVLETPPDELMRLLGVHARAERVVIPSVLEFRLVLNSGAIFGAGQGMRGLFIGFTALALAFAVWLFATRTSRKDWLAHGAIGLVVAGGLGNLYDRLVYGCVRDFIHPLPGVTFPGSAREVWPYVSNVADAFLIVGIAVLMVKLWRHPPAPEGNAGGADGE